MEENDSGRRRVENILVDVFFSSGRKLGKIYTLQKFKKKDLQLTTKW